MDSFNPTDTGIEDDMSYIVWINNNTEGWHPSEELETIAQCYDHVLDMCCGRNFRITKPIDVTMYEA